MNLTPNTTQKHTYTIPQFCDGHNVSRTHFYALLKQGKGPRLMKVGRRNLISAESAAAWRKRMEDETNPIGAHVCTDPSFVVL